MEVLLVLAILVILGALVAMNFGNVLGKADRNAARSQIGLFEPAIKMYFLHLKSYPLDLEALRMPPADLPNPTKWVGPYLEKHVPLDPWGRPYQYAYPRPLQRSDSYDIWSLGPDGQDGTAGRHRQLDARMMPHARSRLVDRFASSRPCGGVRRGFTLLELTLVLALLVVISAMVWPAFEKPLASERLRRGADKVRAEWTRTRVRAMTTGSPHVFRYQPLTNQFTRSKSGAVRSRSWRRPRCRTSALRWSRRSFRRAWADKGLPEGVVFDANSDARGHARGCSSAPRPRGRWRGGRVVRADLLLSRRHDLAGSAAAAQRSATSTSSSSLRGLTGITTVSDVLTAEEVAR